MTIYEVNGKTYSNLQSARRAAIKVLDRSFGMVTYIQNVTNRTNIYTAGYVTKERSWDGERVYFWEPVEYSGVFGKRGKARELSRDGRLI